jgi:hypothetical protein
VLVPVYAAMLVKSMIYSLLMANFSFFRYTENLLLPSQAIKHLGGSKPLLLAML